MSKSWGDVRCCGGESVPSPSGRKGRHRRDCIRYEGGPVIGQERAEDERWLPRSYLEAHSDDDDDTRDVRGEDIG